MVLALYPDGRQKSSVNHLSNLGVFSPPIVGTQIPICYLGSDGFFSQSGEEYSQSFGTRVYWYITNPQLVHRESKLQ